MLDKLREEALGIISDLINKGTRRGQFNSGDMAITSIVCTLSKMVENKEITLDELCRRLNGSGYTKDLSKYTGKIQGMKLIFKK